MMINDVKDHSVFQVLGQFPSTSFKYGHQIQGVLDTLRFQRWRVLYTLLIMLDKFLHMLRISYNLKDDTILQVLDQEPSMSSKYGLRGRGGS